MKNKWLDKFINLYVKHDFYHMVQLIKQEKSKSYQQGYRTRKYITRKYEKDN